MRLLDNKVAVITGAGGGIGSAIASRFATEGSIVICQDLNKSSAEKTLEAVTNAGSDGMVWECDVSDSKAIDEMFEAAAKKYGPVNVLINNAGVYQTKGDGSDQDGSMLNQLIHMTDEAWSKMLEIHLTGAFYCTRAMLRGLSEKKEPKESGKELGTVVCISSIAGLSGWGPVHYSTAKGGLLGFIRSLARMLASDGIRANAVCPGVIETGMISGVPKEMIDGLQMITPMGRIGEADEIAAAVLYLASSESSFVTGQVISPNGGLVI